MKVKNYPRSVPRLLRLLRLPVLALFALGVIVPTARAMTRPLEYGVSVPDPSVVQAGSSDYVVVGTGANVTRLISRNGKIWHLAADALPVRPSWAVPGGDIWAADVRKIGPRFVLYFAAPVKGSVTHCIGVATSATADGTFVPVGDAPLVCPPAASTPPAEDKMLEASAYPLPSPTESSVACTSPTASDSPSGPSSPPTAPLPTCTTLVPGPTPKPLVPTIGAIDPSLFVNNGVPYLIYKSDGRPSTIRMVQLSPDGLHVADGAISSQIVYDGGVIENPVITVHNGMYFLFVSAGDYARCSYATTWRRARSIAGLGVAAPHVILDQKRTRGLCGPGGADVIGRAKATTIYFHAWTCHHSQRPCRGSFHGFPDTAVARAGAVRALYGAKIRWSPRGMPMLGTMMQGPKHRS